MFGGQGSVQRRMELGIDPYVGRWQVLRELPMFR